MALRRMEEKYPEFCFDPKASQELIDVKYRRARLVLAGYGERAVTLRFLRGARRSGRLRDIVARNPATSLPG
jgi:hypothetical protein